MAWQRSGVRAPSAPLPHPAVRDEDSPSAPEFRNHFGYWMERAAAGDEVVITRRGRRFARLVPPDPQLATTGTAPAEEPEAAPEESPPDTARTSP